MKCLSVFCFGAIGGVTRYLMTEHWVISTPMHAVMLVNVLGCFVLGLVAEAVPEIRFPIFGVGLPVGLCGSLTTFCELFPTDPIGLVCALTTLSVMSMLFGTYVGASVGKGIKCSMNKLSQ